MDIYRALFHIASDAMFVVNQHRLITELNDSACQQTGYAKAEMLGRPVGDVITPKSGLLLNDIFPKDNYPYPLHYEADVRHKSGKAVPVELSIQEVPLSGENTYLLVSRDISEITKLEHALRESDARFRTLTEDAPEAILIHDMDSGLFVDATTSAERLFGYSRDEILRHGPQHFYAPSQPIGSPSFETIRERGERILAGEQMTFERIIRQGGGKEILCEVRLLKLPNTKRRLIRASYIDITERRYAEELLQKSERNYRELMEQAGDAITVMDHDAQGYLDVNHAACELLGYARDELLSIDLKELFHPAELIESPLHLKELWAGEVVNVERHLRRKDGHLVTVEITAKMLSDGRLLSIIRDVTSREAVLNELRKSEAWLRSVFDNVNTGIAATDHTGMVTNFNEAFLIMLGYDANALRSMNFADFTHPDDLILEKALFDQILAGIRNSYQITKRYIANHGRILWVDLSAAAVRDTNGKVTNFVAVIRDITDRKAAEDEIEHLAFYDSLTHLPNRRLLMDRLSQAISASARNRSGGALLFIDLDHFKDLNDTLGHAIGDLLLQQIAQRLGTCLRDSDTEARLGGDEFVVMLLGLSAHAVEAAIRNNRCKDSRCHTPAISAGHAFVSMYRQHWHYTVRRQNTDGG
jgi:diguanylate cyclase (GGDEF)-like protein/PAS domain S-box-containing protein